MVNFVINVINEPKQKLSSEFNWKLMPRLEVANGKCELRANILFSYQTLIYSPVPIQRIGRISVNLDIVTPKKMKLTINKQDYIISITETTLTSRSLVDLKHTTADVKISKCCYGWQERKNNNAATVSFYWKLTGTYSVFSFSVSIFGMNHFAMLTTGITWN